MLCDNLCQPTQFQNLPKFLYGFILLIEKARREQQQQLVDEVVQAKNNSDGNKLYLTTANLSDPATMAWHRLYESGLEEAGVAGFVQATGLDRPTFDMLLDRFGIHYEVSSGPGQSGRPRKLQEKSTVLGLLMHYYAGTMEHHTLCTMFCIPPATLSRYLSDAETAIHSALSEIKDAQIRWPSVTEQSQWAQWVNAKERHVKRRWGFIDGKNFPVQEPSVADIQNAFYNGWLHSVLVTGTVCFGADGTIVWCRHNSPGSWNDR
ncbi:hypothetical protein HDU97_003445 [Phlyctochytrium planicorne]|nr:hypothetical protein HDU97_003445 [Phlyctochytrium planicorne]